MNTPVQDIVINAANEGIPVYAIARVVAHPAEAVYEVLKEAKEIGKIVDLPRPDWPPGVARHTRLPSITLPGDDDLAFLCTKTYKLTRLEGGFLVVLLKHRQVEKSRLHHIVEQQRLTRASQPSAMEATDPKMVDVMICKLRKKLKVVDKALKIETIWGGGYYIDTAVKPLIMAHLDGDNNAPQEASPVTSDTREVLVPDDPHNPVGLH